MIWKKSRYTWLTRGLCITGMILLLLATLSWWRMQRQNMELMADFKLCLNLLRCCKLPAPVIINSDGDELCSWRFRSYLNSALPNRPLDMIEMYSWKDEVFMDWRAKAPREYCNPDSKMTRIFAITGPGTVFDEYEGSFLGKAPPHAIVLVEIRNSNVHWMQPGDFDIQTMPSVINSPDGQGISSQLPGRFLVGFADGKVWCLSDQIPFEKLRLFFTADSAKQNDRDEVLGPFRTNVFSFSFRDIIHGINPQQN